MKIKDESKSEKDNAKEKHNNLPFWYILNKYGIFFSLCPVLTYHTYNFVAVN